MIFLIFIFIPIIEIVIFITVGSNIGILNTIAIILLTAIVGIFFVKRQGLSLLFNAQRNMSQGIFPTQVYFLQVYLYKYIPTSNCFPRVHPEGTNLYFM